MIQYQSHANDIEADQLQGFFVGWPNPPSSKTHLHLLKRSSHIVLAIDDSTNSIIGFINAISDHVLCAYIPLLEVLPEYQGNGIGSELVRRLLSYLDGFYMIDLICDEKLQPFYDRLGMQPALGMVVRDFDNQSGTS